jgi:pilus assembly protein CpaD
MIRTISSAALIALGLSVSGCGPETNRLQPYANPSLSSVNQPVVSRTDYVLDLSTTGSGVPDSELARLDDWFASLQLAYGDRVSTDGYGDPVARQDVARVAEAYGLLLADGAPVTAGRVQPGSVRVIVSRSVAEVPGCPHYDSREVGERNTTSPNYGCATNSNLARMVADPSDLVLGRSGAAAGDAATTAKAIKTYRDRIPTGAAAALTSEKTGEK